MTGSIEGFKEEYQRCVDECDLDSLCIRWLKLTCMENGETGEHASALLNVVGQMLNIS